MTTFVPLRVPLSISTHTHTHSHAVLPPQSHHSPFPSPTSFHTLTRIEGIMPALESSHALAYAARLAADRPSDDIIIVNLSGRGDKDILTVAEIDGISF